MVVLDQNLQIEWMHACPPDKLIAKKILVSELKYHVINVVGAAANNMIIPWLVCSDVKWGAEMQEGTACQFAYNELQYYCCTGGAVQLSPTTTHIFNTFQEGLPHGQ